MPLREQQNGSLAVDGNFTLLAQNLGDTAHSCEASWIQYAQGNYYLYVNWGKCCIGVNSTYNIRVGRSKSVTGPFLDKDGKDMAQGGA